ncbi:DUF6730 family protein [Salegentibacter sp. T436]|uniref:DUF6730 family protein n=1 Tax=Salegentibacter sp. T436 TaxID=1729720 RepID=UPI00094A578A|nr:DUF6730 family protein [Salegentibacter sp. T436]APS40247.1 hypothetical protein AO058_15755 [Salegentibacter sp. T436]|tara:strand:- start:1090 stop:1389 length:300 start_codon:yes stop_codon:yes gene_type:complete
MAKLEQLSELLVSEISQFEKTVQRLEKIQKEKVGIDSTAFEKVLLQHQEKMEEGFTQYSLEMKSLGVKLKEAKAYPVWALTLFTVSLMANVVLVCMLFS